MVKNIYLEIDAKKGQVILLLKMNFLICLNINTIDYLITMFHSKKKKLKELFTEDLHIANWGRRYAEMELLATEERLISMLSAIASERYKELIEKEPDLLQRLPLGNIATYLGITQASLSRIRAQIK